ncbi:MAG: tRNA (N(6)-L-threonylcarbamoyladenosine(37)-C(2))-methylthiotransferase MtaB [Lentisphaeria bacterium]|nr:tRNA (N(6)-L-threonylcarbamoyladenosine(37)-C(2))-methylthiotransferase MtaB [Lentisphaeria bacterium]
MKKTAVVRTLGCRLNSADTALLQARLEGIGCTILPDDAASFDIAVLNTCAVTAEAVRKSRQELRKLRRLSPHAVIAVAGCAVEAAGDSFRQDGADLILTNPDKKDIADILAGLPAANRSSLEMTENFCESAQAVFPFRSRAFVKIQEGCGNFCTYCIVPLVRGPERSRKFDEVVSECRRLTEEGFPEIILTGVNTCAYADEGRDLGDLVRAVAALPGDFRIRLSSTEPHVANRSIIDVMAETPKVCRFLHLSLQHGCDRILRAMNRHYLAEEYADFVSEARRKIPGLHLGSDVIAGFPGETEEDFAECAAFVRRMDFANLHVFTYSPRPGTPAADMPDRPDGKTAERRAAVLRQIGAEGKKHFIRSQIGSLLPVIFETVSEGTARGWSDNYIQVSVPADSVKTGVITSVRADEKNTGPADGG